MLKLEGTMENQHILKYLKSREVNKNPKKRKRIVLSFISKNIKLPQIILPPHMGWFFVV